MSRQLFVNSSSQTLELRRDDVLQFSAPVSTAKLGLGEEPNSYKTPRGRHRIDEKIGAGAPIRTIFESRKAAGIWNGLPSDKDLILSRILWLAGEEDFNRSTKSRFIYIHGTNDEAHIGQPASHGCIRMRNADVITLFELVNIGTKIHIS